MPVLTLEVKGVDYVSDQGFPVRAQRAFAEEKPRERPCGPPGPLTDRKPRGGKSCQPDPFCRSKPNRQANE
jgi:hypothetical protein